MGVDALADLADDDDVIEVPATGTCEGSPELDEHSAPIVLRRHDEHGVKRPGLLVEWRAAASGWEGRVVYAASLRAGRWSLVEEWVPASRLTPL